MAEKEPNADFNLHLDSLEVAISDESRKVIRQIKAEWQKVMKYRNDLSATEEELASTKEKLMHLNDIKDQYDKYLKATRSRIKNLKQSNIQLKKKLNNREKEQERVAKNCAKEEEYMNEKLSFHKEKWRQRYETYYSKDPKVQEKERAKKELVEGRQKLHNLDVELQKYENELFQAKCDRNKRSVEESRFHPFNIFVINIANIYVETEREYEDCKEVSEEIAIMEKNIEAHKSKYKTCHSEDNALKQQNVKHVHFENKIVNEENLKQKANMETWQQKQNIDRNHEERKVTEEIFTSNINIVSDKSKYSVLHVEDNSPKLQGMKHVNFENKNIPGKIDSQEGSSTIFIGDNLNSIKITTQTEMCKNKEMAKSPMLQMGRGNSFMKPRDSKISKWMERLKVFIPKFSAISTEIYKFDTESNTKISNNNLPQTENVGTQLTHEQNNSFYDNGKMDFEDSTKENISCFQTKETSSNVDNDANKQNDLSAPKKHSEISPINMNVNTHMFDTNEIHTSKYFKLSDTNSTVNKYVENTDIFKDTAKSFVQDKVVHNITDDTMDVDKVSNEQESLNKRQQASNEYHAINNLIENSQQNIFHPSYDENETIVNASILCDNTSTYASNLDTETGSFQVRFGNLKVSEVTAQHIENQETENIISSENKSGVPMSTSESTKQTLQNKESPTSTQIQIFTSSQIQISESKQPDQNLERNTSSDHNSNRSEDYTNNASEFSHQDRNSEAASSVPAYLTAHSAPSTAKYEESNPKTPTTKPIQSSIEAEENMEVSSFASFKTEDSASPGFMYTTRLMYQANAANAAGDSCADLTQNSRNDLFGAISFFNNPNNANYPNIPSNKSEEKSEFLALAYEDYLNDSPPMIQGGTEKNMFAFAEDSPDADQGPGDFFPLFATDNTEATKDLKTDNAPFMLNFASSSNAKSPDTSSDFKFLF